MTIWVDAQLSPALATWISSNFDVSAQAVRNLGLREAKDFSIFQAAREADVVVMTKDSDFVHLLALHGAPPSVLWITCGNTSNAYLRQLLEKTLQKALELLASGEELVEITGPTSQSSD